MSLPPQNCRSMWLAGLGRADDRYVAVRLELRRIGSRPSSRITKPDRRDDAEEHQRQQDPRVDPAQHLGQLHPQPVRRRQDPRRHQRRARRAGRRGPEPTAGGSGLAHQRPEADQAEDAADQEAEAPQLLRVDLCGRRRAPDSVQLELFAPVAIVRERLLRAFSRTQFSRTSTSISVRMKHR